MRSRIVRVAVAVACLAMLLLATPLAIAVSSLYNNEAAQGLLADAARAAASVPAPPLEAGDPIEVPSPSSGATIAVYAPSGARVAGTGPLQADAVTVDALHGRLTSASKGGELTVAVPVGAQEQLVGAVRAALPQSAVDARVHGTWLAMAGLGVAAIVVAALLALWQARRLSRPLHELAVAAGQLGKGNLAARTSPSNIKEIDTVASAMHATSDRLAGALARERAFSSDASHQLRTPLTAMRIRLEGALEAPGADQRERIEAALGEIDRLERSVDELLRLARDVPGDRRPLDIATMLNGWAPTWRSSLQQHGRRLHLTIAPELPNVAVSESALQQILAVLVDNASVHGAGTVSVSARALSGGVAIDVTDQGQGVSDAHQVFERRHSGGGGSGIGLALARSLAEAEQGRLTLVTRGPHPCFRLAFVANHE